MPERQCDGCTNKEAWGCRAYRWREPDPDEPDDRDNWVNPAHLPITLEDGTDSYACPRQDLLEDPRSWSRLLMFYGMYSKGHLPNRGAIVDQSNVLMEAFRVLDDANAEADRQLAENEKRRQSRNSALSKGAGGKG